MFKKRFATIMVLTLSFCLYADYSLDSNSDGYLDIWVEEKVDESCVISSDTNHDGNIDSKIAMNNQKLTVFEETDYNLDGIMDNFYYFENGYVVRQEVDSNYDQKIDVWVYITNNGKSIQKYEKDTDFDGVVDKVKEFEVYKEEDGE